MLDCLAHGISLFGANTIICESFQGKGSQHDMLLTADGYQSDVSSFKVLGSTEGDNIIINHNITLLSYIGP